MDVSVGRICRISSKGPPVELSPYETAEKACSQLAVLANAACADNVRVHMCKWFIKKMKETNSVQAGLGLRPMLWVDILVLAD